MCHLCGHIQTTPQCRPPNPNVVGSAPKTHWDLVAGRPSGAAGHGTGATPAPASKDPAASSARARRMGWICCPPTRSKPSLQGASKGDGQSGLSGPHPPLQMPPLVAAAAAASLSMKQTTSTPLSKWRRFAVATNSAIASAGKICFVLGRQSLNSCSDKSRL